MKSERDVGAATREFPD